jgi:hypothetical protein
MFNAAMVLSPNNRDQLTVAGVKRIGDPHLKCRTPGIMPLV